MKVTLPDGTPLELARGRHAAPTPPRRSAPGWRAPRWPSSRTASCATSRSRSSPTSPLEIVTDRSGQDALDLIRHDAAHVLAAAVMELYPGVKISIGPPIENGFYYDFEFPDGVTLSDADFEAIEAKMREHIAADEPFEREDVPGRARRSSASAPRARTTRSS